MEKQPKNVEVPMPLTSEELLALRRCLRVALHSEEIKEADKELLRKMGARIDRYAERQGAYWDE